MGKNGTIPARWFLVVKPDQRELFELLRERLDGSGLEVLIERRTRERRRGSFGPGGDRRVNDRRRQRPVALLAVAAETPEASESTPAARSPRAVTPRPQEAAVTHQCPTCASAIELDLPRFPHPPARVEMEVAHVTGNTLGAQHYVEIAAFTVSGRLILSQRVPGRRPV